MDMALVGNRQRVNLLSLDIMWAGLKLN